MSEHVIIRWSVDHVSSGYNGKIFAFILYFCDYTRQRIVKSMIMTRTLVRADTRWGKCHIMGC
jgi:hypothetical protein